MNKKTKQIPVFRRGQRYYYIDSSGNIKTAEWFDTSDDHFGRGQENCFATEEEAQKHFEKAVVWARFIAGIRIFWLKLLSASTRIA